MIWTTRTTSATMETASPTNEVPWPIQSRKKRALLRRESFVESILQPRNETHHWPLSNALLATGPLLRLTDGAVYASPA